MKILVTGGTGFVGAHSVAALVAAGHSVRLLARTPAKVAATLAPLGGPVVETVAGDVTRPDDVRAALAGCDAVLHAANVYTLDPRRRYEMFHTNTTSTEQVLELAHQAGCDPIVHVSSSTVLYPARGTIPADPPIGARPSPGYVESKHAAEVIARDHQGRGRPVVTTYPGSVWGPHDPHGGEMVHLLHGFLGNRYCFRFARRTGWPIADVGWVARAHAALFTPGLGPRRVTLTGQYVPWRSMFAILRELTGRRLPMVIPAPPPVALATGWLASALQRILPWRLPFSFENVWIMHRSAPTDDRIAHGLIGPPPPIEDTVAAAVQWALDAGHLPPRYGGKLRPALPAAAP